MRGSKEKLKGTFKKNVNLMSLPLMSILPGQISFFVILSVIPLLSIIVMIISRLSLNYEMITIIVSHYLPKGVTEIILSILEEQKAGVIDLLFIVTAFYLASKATHSIIVASTQIYHGRQRNFLRTRIKAILMLIILILLVIFIISILSVGSRLVIYLSGVSKSINPYVSTIYSVLKWPFVFFMIFVVIKVIYTVAPNVDIPSKTVNKGALFTTCIWVASTYIYSFYVTNVANYSRFYGNLSNIIILMIWIYWLCYIFVYGMTINEDELKNISINPR